MYKEAKQVRFLKQPFLSFWEVKQKRYKTRYHVKVVSSSENDQNDETTVTNTASLKSKKYVYLVHPLIIVKI